MWAEGEVAAARRAGRCVPEGGPWGPAVCHCTLMVSLFPLSSQEGVSRAYGGGVATFWDPHPGPERQALFPKGFLGWDDVLALGGVCGGARAPKVGPASRSYPGGPGEPPARSLAEPGSTWVSCFSAPLAVPVGPTSGG